MFEPVDPKSHFPDLEEGILEFWRERDIFQKSVANRDGRDEYVFYDGPPFATGLPHYGHLLAGTIKDIVPRYWTMQGKRVERRFGWDCHGLPVENEAAKGLKEEAGLDLSGKYEIENFGIAKFNEYCRSIVLRYTKEWEEVVERMGRWVDFRNGYRTMDKDFMESIWWVFRQLWDKGLVYEGHRVMPFSWKLSTPLSNFEANMNYQDVQDPAITVKFAALDAENTYFLAWTTTPWTLPSNLALAVGADIEYAEVVHAESGDRLILAAARLAHYEKLLKTSLETVGRHLGRDLVGRRYAPVFPYFDDCREQGAFRVVASDHVKTEDGTGIVHMAPAFGEDDYRVCAAEGMPLVDPVDMEGRFTGAVTDCAGQHVKDADKYLIRKLKESGKLLHQGTIQHSYPFCWRSDTPLIYKAISAWFIKVEAIKDQLIENNDTISWVPDFVGSKRFGNWLAGARDWNISRNRYWGTPLPIWRDEDSGECLAIGSVAELESLTGAEVPDLHAHFIDHLTIERDGKTYRRIAEVFDCWFESGAMPYGQGHYPFEGKASFEKNFPADFIAEGLDQTRGWFYTLNVLSTALFGKPAFKNVVVNGLILAEDGQKMSKKKKNYPDPMEMIGKYGADCLRSYLINSPVVRAEPLRFQEAGIVQIFRTVVSPFWNAYAFFVTYARVDDFQPGRDPAGSSNELDLWILSRFQTLTASVTKHMEHNHLYAVVPELQSFIDELTNWYIRRSRRRFWRNDEASDKAWAYDTLYTVLVEFAKLMCPFLPFLCEAIYRNLTRNGNFPESVHLCDYPKPRTELIDGAVEEDMAVVRMVVELGRSLRVAHNLKTRQPLSRLSVAGNRRKLNAIERMESIVIEELNVKEVVRLEDGAALMEYSARPDLKVLGPRLGKALKVLNPAIRQLTHDQIHAFIRDGELEVAGHRLSKGDLLIDHREKPGLVVQSGEGITVALDTGLTPGLILEGDARELVNRIQNMRKEADYQVDDRIRLHLESETLAACLAEFGDYVCRETLALGLDGTSGDPDIDRDEEINGKTVRVRMARAQD